MATIFGIILVGVPIVLVCSKLDRIANFIESFIRWHFHD